MRWAEWRFRVMFAGKGKSDALPGIREIIDSGRLAQMQAAGIRTHQDFEEVFLVTGEAQYLADRFFDLSGGRSGGGWGVTPLTWQDFWAYCQVRGVTFSNWEISLLQALDGEFCKNANRKD